MFVEIRYRRNNCVVAKGRKNPGNSNPPSLLPDPGIHGNDSISSGLLCKERYETQRMLIIDVRHSDCSLKELAG